MNTVDSQQSLWFKAICTKLMILLFVLVAILLVVVCERQIHNQIQAKDVEITQLKKQLESERAEHRELVDRLIETMQGDRDAVMGLNRQVVADNKRIKELERQLAVARAEKAKSVAKKVPPPCKLKIEGIESGPTMKSGNMTLTPTSNGGALGGINPQCIGP